MPTKESKYKKRNRSIPGTVRDEVLREAGYMCGNPRCRHIITLELHHIIWLRDDGPNTASNLIALCPNCHALHTRGHIPQTAIRHWKGMLVALNHAFSRESTDLLLFLHTTGPNSLLWYSADGVLKFASLIAAGLVCFGQQAASMANIPTSSHKLTLSEKGMLLVEAWKNGNEETYRALLTKDQQNEAT